MAYRQGQKSYRAVYPSQTTTDAGVQYSASFPGRYVAIFDHLAGHLHERALQLNQSTTSGDLPDWAAPLTAFIIVGSTSRVTLDIRASRSLPLPSRLIRRTQRPLQRRNRQQRWIELHKSRINGAVVLVTGITIFRHGNHGRRLRTLEREECPVALEAL